MIKNISKRLAKNTLSTRGQLKDRENGFTLVELLITVVIIAILTAIAVPAYISVVTNAQDSAAKQTISSVIGAQDLYYAGSGSPRNSAHPVGVFGNGSDLTTAGLITIDSTKTVLKRGTNGTVAAVGVLSENGKGWYSTTNSRQPIQLGAGTTTLAALQTAVDSAAP